MQTQHALLFILFVIILTLGSVPLMMSYSNTKVEVYHQMEYPVELYNITEEIEEKVYYSDLQVNHILENIDLETSHIEFYNQFTKDSEISEAIVKWSIHFDVPVHSAFALAYVESWGFNPEAKGSKNRNGTRDWGLFQLNDRWHKWTVDEFFDIDKNSQGGIKMLAYARENYDSKSFAFLAYNMGVSGASEWAAKGEVPEFRKEYVTNLLEYESLLDEEFNKWYN